jgi:hypothetical protein
MAYLARQRLIAPGYTVMQEMIGDVLQREKERLIAIAQSHLTEQAVAALNNLLINPRGLYEITQVKREPKDFSIKAGQNAPVISWSSTSWSHLPSVFASLALFRLIFVLGIRQDLGDLGRGSSPAPTIQVCP